MSIPYRLVAPTKNGAQDRRRSGTREGCQETRPRPPEEAEYEKESRRTRVLRWAVIFVLLLFVAAVAFVAGGYVALVKAVENLDEVSAAPSHPTYIYSKPVGETEGSTRVIGTIFQGENRKTAALEDIAPSLLDALVAKEDERFREHGGVDLWGITLALYRDIKAGEAVAGGSTLTQQYVKNAYLSGDQSLQRKIKEATIAVELERNTRRTDPRHVLEHDVLRQQLLRCPGSCRDVLHQIGRKS